jgi:hypothetical protein
MSSPRTNLVTLDPTAAATRRAALPKLLSFIESSSTPSAPPPRDTPTEPEPHWTAAIDAATD